MSQADSPNTFPVLRDVVARVQCRPGWTFRVGEEDGAVRLYVTIDGHDNYRPERPFRVTHVLPVPTATYNERSWTRWVFEQCRRVMNHELGEAFAVDGVRPFAPLHGPGEDPYTVHEYRDAADALVTQDGSSRPGPR